MRSRLSEHLDTQIVDNDFIPTEFSPYVKNQVKIILKNDINDQAVNRKQVEAITLDWLTSLDLDDAIWAERTKKGYCIWIHISDVAEVIPIFSPIDREAFQRTTSIYRRDRIINMLPPELANDFLSLNENGKKYTMTLQIELDHDANVTSSCFYESCFKNMKRYNYESFGEDYENPDSQYHKTLHLFREISDKLRMNRIKKGGIVPYDEQDRRMYIWPKQIRENFAYGEKIAHDIIESFMVLANVTTGNYIQSHMQDGIFKHHQKMDERSFYTHKTGFHTWLGVFNYTHFTSPIRRYVDIIIHRTIKAIERKEKFPYHISDLKIIASHANNTRLKIETIWSQVDFEYRWQKFLERAQNRLGKCPEVYDMKEFIRYSTHKGRKMPNCMKQAIKERIEKSSLDTWAWSIGVILFWKDRGMKEFLRKKLLDEKCMSPCKVLNVIAQTQILRWWESIFTKNEIQKHNTFKIEMLLHNKKICGYSMDVWKFGTMKQIKYRVWKKILERIFDYFIDL